MFSEVIDKEIIFFFREFLERDTTNSNIITSITIRKHTTFSILIRDENAVHLLSPDYR
jgi:hypothetical protein